MSTIPEACGEPLPSRALEAIRLFNTGEYYRQHDLLEAQWREESRPVRELYQGILQVGVGYYQLLRGNRRGAIKLLRRGLRRLEALPAVCQGVDVAGLQADALRVCRALEAMPPDADLATFDRSLLKPIKLVNR